MASLDADAVVGLRFPLPPVLPTGTLKLRLLVLANATTGAAKLTVSDGVAIPAASPAASGNPSAVTLTAEAQTTIPWASAQNDRYKEAKVTLSAAPAGNNQLVVAVTFNTTGWTLAQVSTWIFSILWE